MMVPPHDERWVSPFGHSRINAWSATPRDLTQPPTSFIGIRHQGIHRWPYTAWNNKKMLILALQHSTHTHPKQPPGTEQQEAHPRRGGPQRLFAENGAEEHLRHVRPTSQDNPRRVSLERR